MKALDEIIRAEYKQPKTFHPIHERNQDAWFPGNEAASLLIQIRHIFDDIEIIRNIRALLLRAYPNIKSLSQY